MAKDSLVIRGARVHNLKNVDLELPRRSLVVFTGLSGSGKSSLAFDTIYAEGQRRYVESLSAYARQFLGLMEKPDVDVIEGLSPAISIEQKTLNRNPRSTVGTITEIYDYLRVLWARVGVAHCRNCGKPVAQQSPEEVADILLSLGESIRIEILAPLVRSRKGEFRELLEKVRIKGFVRAVVDGEQVDLSAPPDLNRYENHDISVVIDRLVLSQDDRERLTESISAAFSLAGGVTQVVEHRGKKEVERFFSENYSCFQCGTSIPEIEPRQFSFNSPHGACEKCKGLGTTNHVNPELLVGDESKSLAGGVLLAWGKPSGYLRKSVIAGLAEAYEFSAEEPWKNLSPEVKEAILHGSGEMKIRFPYRRKRGKKFYEEPWIGLIQDIHDRHQETNSEVIRSQLEEYMSTLCCPDCLGSRLKGDSLSVTVAGRSLGEITGLPISETLEFFKKISLDLSKGKPSGSQVISLEIAQPILREVHERLSFLNEVGLSYLTLGRSAASLSGGESQRIQLASQIGSGLTGVLYVLDEPSIGLHQKDNSKLIGTLKSLKELGNTVIVVEHDEETMRAADYIVDLGPGAGITGGEVVAEGTLDEIMAETRSLTGSYLSGSKCIEIPANRRLIDRTNILSLKGAQGNNLNNLDVDIPLGCFVAVTGVSGSGKSTLINQTLYPALARHFYRSKKLSEPYDDLQGLDLIDKVIEVDQSPIGRTPRSNPATYTGLFTPIRELFANLSESKIRGYDRGRFSFNVKGGRCEGCAGDGLVKIEMHFLPDVYVSCDVCRGRRYNRETLDIVLKGRNISDVLNMTVREALEFFNAFPSIRDKLQTLSDVGLDYIHLGQAATTLSGGEAQRVKLSTELSKRGTGKTLYVLDEPTTGLHFEDVRVLLEVLHELVDKGNTVIVVEHNLEVIKTADWIIDLGPEGGYDGGNIVAEGTPETVINASKSHTATYLRNALKI
jgi:excinuclease ABC subunit A